MSLARSVSPARAVSWTELQCRSPTSLPVSRTRLPMRRDSFLFCFAFRCFSCLSWQGRVAVGDSYWCIEELNNNNVRQRSCPPGHSTSTTALPSPCLSPSGAKKVPTDAEMEKKPWLAMDLVESSEATQARSLGRNSADYDSSEHLADPPMSSSDEADETTKIISLYLKKKPPLPSTAAGAASTLPPDWGGVLEGEEVEDIFYDHAPSKMRDLEPRHRSKSW